MPCDTKTQDQIAKEKRAAALKALIDRLKNHTARIVRNGNKVSIEGWAERGGWCDECAVRALRISQDMVARQAVAQAAPAGLALTYGHGH